jgi:DNA repair protein RadA/Sms
MLLAVLHKHGGVATADQDVFLNVAGGLRVAETAADLPMVVAVMSSLRDQLLPQDLIVFGELGLSGELRPVPCGQERLKEAVKHGMRTAVVPSANKPKKPIDGLTVIAVDHLQDAFAAVADLAQPVKRKPRKSVPA